MLTGGGGDAIPFVADVVGDGFSVAVRASRFRLWDFARVSVYCSPATKPLR